MIALSTNKGLNENTKIVQASAQWAKSPKKTVWHSKYNTVSYCQKYTPIDCFFGDFALWVYRQSAQNS